MIDYYIFVENKVNKFEFNPKVECSNVPSHLIQINCTNEELDRRIDTFMKRKREQINHSNISEFCGNVDEGCARVNISLRRPKNTKSHLRSMYTFVISRYIQAVSDYSKTLLL